MSESHSQQLRKEFGDKDYREAYADSFLDAWIALQIRTVREQRNMTQTDLAIAMNTTQTAISRLESANYSGRSILNLKSAAKALDCRLRVSLETYGSLVGEAGKFCAEFLQRPSFKEDPEMQAFSKMPEDILSTPKTASEPSDNVEQSAHRAQGNVVELRPKKPINDLISGTRKIA